MEDRRGMRGGPVAISGGFGLLAIIVLALLMGIDPMALLGPPGGQMQPGQPGAVERQPNPAQDDLVAFVRTVLASTEDVWREQFQKMDLNYRDPRLVLFSDNVSSACGFASAAVGPFYCPADRKVYLDLDFFRQLQSKFGAPGDFAQAYVIAHEIGHHVQNQMGISERVSQMRGRVSQEEYNQLSVRLELQADFLAGVWAHHAEQQFPFLEAGDVEEALRAASAIGDDTLQRQTQGYVVPDAFTHGTSQQRVRWFARGLKSGRLSDGNTFEAEEL